MLLEERFAVVLDEWREVEARAGREEESWVRAAEALLQQLQEERNGLQRAGRWRSGPRTLLQAVGVHGLEVPLTSGLAWLLRPDGHHGLGDGLLRRLLERAGLPGEPGWPVTVVLEEVRDDTRADVVIRTQNGCVLIEAKLGAPEQPRQCERLERLWADESPMCVFLTRDGRPPTTATTAWVALRWADVAGMLRASLPDQPGGGELDFLATLETFYR